MFYLTVLLIAIGLSFDSFAVSVTSGLLKKDIRFRMAARIAFSLAAFQTVMPVIGWLAGSGIKDYIKSYDHWVAFALLGMLGLKMIADSQKPAEVKKETDPLSFLYIIGISLATSIDALVVGFSFACLGLPIFSTVLIIGIITFIISMLGILAGKKTGERSGKKMEIIGGIILFCIGLKILIEHLYFNP